MFTLYGQNDCTVNIFDHRFQVLHMDYVVAAANLYGQIFGVKGTTDHASVRNVLQGVHVPPFTPKSSVKIQLTDKELEEERKRESGDPGKSGDFFPLNTPPSHASKGFPSDLNLCVSSEKARLEELKMKLASGSLRDSAKQMWPIDFEKVG